MQMDSILSLLTFTDDQRRTVTAREPYVAVTAGAGAGKTRVLVGRYLRLLEDGLPLHSVAAITFTEKAAREMRTRIRHLIRRWLSEASALDDDPRWEGIYAELDAAPIGTIHSLCAALLRAYPAEARIDPTFEVLDEARSAVLRAQAVEAALLWAANDPQAAPLFLLFTEIGFRQAVSTLLENRLDAKVAFDASGPDPLPRWQSALCAQIAAFLDDPAVRSAVGDLESLRSERTLAGLAGDTLAIVIADFLTAWDVIWEAWEVGDLETLLEQLPRARQAMQPRKGRKSHWADIETPRQALALLRERYEATVAKLLKQPLDWSLDHRIAAALPHLRAVFEQAERGYAQAKEQRHALDFDGLEAGALALLEGYPAVRAWWQREVRAVLVDEFQDTNDRQRRIVYALAGFGEGRATTTGDPAEERAPGQLFIVGDAKQSIYRFRGADVTVFREVQRDVGAAGGRVAELNHTFRAHEPLLRQLNALMEELMGTEEDTARPYQVPFAALRAHRMKPGQERLREPYVEFCLGLGGSATAGREAAAEALAGRLHGLHDQEGIDWGEIGLLFRASTGFPPYEDALERAGIPFVTVAGRGFYDRPEVRNLLNALRAIADPTDDRALVGLLRSSMCALSDGALYLLRRGQAGMKRGLWEALHNDLSLLEEHDRTRAQRAREIVAELNGQVGRTTVAGVLKHLLDLTNYHAILRLSVQGEASMTGGQVDPVGRSTVAVERVRRNVDKLLADAHASRLVSIGEFLEYLQVLRDVAAREGEAPVEAGDAVQLMTVHKAKGLEFPVLVIADAARRPRKTASRLLLDEKLGPVLNLDGDDGRSAVYRLAILGDQDRGEAEDRRLLYVAATRSREKLLISGHVGISTTKKDAGKLVLDGWLKPLGQIVGLDQVRVEGTLDEPLSVALPDLGGHPVDCGLSLPTAADRGSQTATEQPRVEGLAADRQQRTERAPGVCFPPALLEPVAVEEIDEILQVREAEPPPRVWRVIPSARRPRGPAWVVGTLVHAALHRWCFPNQEDFDKFMRLQALEVGLMDETELRATLTEVRRLLRRFQAHPLYAEMDKAERYHEVPYTLEREGRIEVGKIDLLCYDAGRWTIVDFKTDQIQDEDELREKVTKHAHQVRAYETAVGQLCNMDTEGWLCYLNVAGEVRVEPVPTNQAGP